MLYDDNFTCKCIKSIYTNACAYKHVYAIFCTHQQMYIKCTHKYVYVYKYTNVCVYININAT